MTKLEKSVCCEVLEFADDSFAGSGKLELLDEDEIY